METNSVNWRSGHLSNNSIQTMLAILLNLASFFRLRPYPFFTSGNILFIVYVEASINWTSKRLHQNHWYERSLEKKVFGLSERPLTLNFHIDLNRFFLSKRSKVSEKKSTKNKNRMRATCVMFTSKLFSKWLFFFLLRFLYSVKNYLFLLP